MKTISEILPLARSIIHNKKKYYAIIDLAQTITPETLTNLPAHEAITELLISDTPLACIPEELAADYIGILAARQQEAVSFKDKLTAALKKTTNL